MQWALQGKLADGPLLEACLHDQRFHHDVAEPRGSWLWRLINKNGAADQFREPILRSLHSLHDECSALQLCQLARHFAERGDEAFRCRLYEIVDQKPIKDMPWLGEEELVILDGKAGFQFAARLRGRSLQSREWEWDDGRLIDCAAEWWGLIQTNDLFSDSSDSALNRFLQVWQRQLNVERPTPPSRREQIRSTTADQIISAAELKDVRFGLFRTWGMYADAADLEIVLQRLWASTSAHSLSNLLCVFANRSLPQFDVRLIELCGHENKTVRWRALGALAKNKHPQIRRFALQRLNDNSSDEPVVRLFVNNYEPGDERRLLSLLELPPSEDNRHSLLMDLNLVLETNAEADCSQLAEMIYASTPCENCRYFALRLLHARPGIPAWIREECHYDSGEDCRQISTS